MTKIKKQLKQEDKFDVYDDKTFIRTYDKKTHGKDAKKLAKQFCEKKKTYNIK
jgi:hypothetical protein